MTELRRLLLGVHLCGFPILFLYSGAARTMTLEKNGARGGDLKPPEGKCKLHPSTAVFQPQEEMTTVSQGDLNEDTNFLQLRDDPSALTSRHRTAWEESNIP